MRLSGDSGQKSVFRQNDDTSLSSIFGQESHTDRKAHLFGPLCGKCAGLTLDCKCKDKSALATSDTASDTDSTSTQSDGNDSLRSLILKPGQTSLRDRVFNLIDRGSPEAALTLLGYAMDNMDDTNCTNILDLATTSQKLMREYGFGDSANILGDALSAWGVEPEEEKPQPQLDAEPELNGFAPVFAMGAPSF